MFPGTYVPRYPCSPVHIFPGTYVPRTYVPRYLCSPVHMKAPIWKNCTFKMGAYLCPPVPMFPGTHVPRYLCSPVPMFPEPMFPGTYVPRYIWSPVPMFPDLRLTTAVERGSSAVECRTRNQVSPGSIPPLLLFRRVGIFILSIDAPVDAAV